MNIKKTILFSMIALFFAVTSCTNKKETISKSIIDSYVQAVQEEDNRMMIKTFPRIIYFKEYPKIDSVKINEYEEKKENILAKGSLYFTNGFNKKFDRKIQFLVNLKDSSIVDVLGFLTRKKRNEIRAYNMFEIFPDLKPSETDFDATYLENKQIAYNRINGFNYYAQKAIGERTKVKVTSSSKARYSYGINMGYSNTKILIDISNNSDFNIIYEYVDGNYGYNYTFPDFITHRQDEYNTSTKGRWLINSNDAISQNAIVKEEQTFEYVKDKITIKPVFDNLEEAISIVKKYYDSETVNSILEGKKDYWNDYYNFKIDIK